jgi:hypothetical protein
MPQKWSTTQDAAHGCGLAIVAGLIVLALVVVMALFRYLL